MLINVRSFAAASLHEASECGRYFSGPHLPGGRERAGSSAPLFRSTGGADNVKEFMRHDVTDADERPLHYCFLKQDAKLTRLQATDGIHWTNRRRTP